MTWAALEQEGTALSSMGLARTEVRLGLPVKCHSSHLTNRSGALEDSQHKKKKEMSFSVVLKGKTKQIEKN